MSKKIQYASHATKVAVRRIDAAVSVERAEHAFPQFGNAVRWVVQMSRHKPSARKAAKAMGY
jgi:hypothetical protein